MLIESGHGGLFLASFLKAVHTENNDCNNNYNASTPMSDYILFIISVCCSSVKLFTVVWIIIGLSMFLSLITWGKKNSESDSNKICSSVSL